MPVPATPLADLQLIEVFSSIQGEGLFAGCRQIFVRLARCNLACAYCDTPFELSVSCRIEDAPGSGQFRSLANPVSGETLAAILAEWIRLRPGLHQAVSLTGGEPLLQAEGLREWLPALAELLPLHLETNGTLAAELPALLPHLSFVSLDIKLASTTGQTTPWEAHRAFLQALGETPGQVKLVVGEMTTAEELRRAAALVHAESPRLPLILQPVTVHGRPQLTGAELLSLQEIVSAHHPDSRILPQLHPLLDLL